MANSFDALGLSLATRDYWVQYFSDKFQEIYGPDVNLASDTPDGQLIGILVQTILDLQDLIGSVNAGFDPDEAIGVVLDQRVAINGIQRQAGTYTVTPITIVNDRSINLYGLDQSAQPVYTVSDNEGNRWLLQTTELGLAAGTHSLNFRAENVGAELTIPNTITTPVTIVLGVVSVNNPLPYTTLGVNEESDAQLKVRRQKSVSLASQGYLAGLRAALLNVTGVIAAFVYENTGASVDSNGVPGHSIWVIVDGSALQADIANAIYRKRNAGCGMYGDETYIVTQIDGTPFEIKWDVVVNRTLYAKCQLTSIDGVVAPQTALIRQEVPEKYKLEIFQPADVTAFGTAVQEVDSNALVTNAGLSLADQQQFQFSGNPSSGSFKVVYNGNTSAAILYSDDDATAQTKIRAVPGLSTVVCSGFIAFGFFYVDLSSLDDVVEVLSFADNTLADGGMNPVNITIQLSFVNVVSSVSAKSRLLLKEETVILLPMSITPYRPAPAPLATVNFSGVGGYGAYRYAITLNASGGSINATTGVYTAGATPGEDIVEVTDQLGNTAGTEVYVT